MVYLTSIVIGAGGGEEGEADDKYVCLFICYLLLLCRPMTFHDEPENNMHFFFFFFVRVIDLSSPP
jgi:hypothetical protein